jgi:glycosyltransferase involved in cell wall biosynthesis
MFRGRVVAVVIPAYNEADKITGTIRSVPGFVDHVIVVDDGSADATAAIARGAARRASGRRRIEVVVHPNNRGVGAAIVTGYARALALGAQATAVMAGDGQMDPADLPRLLAPVVGGQAEYAKGNRFAWPGGWRMMPRVRLFGSVVLSWLTRLATGYRQLRDSQCGYTVASRHALLAIGFGDPQRVPHPPRERLARGNPALPRAIGSDLFPRYGYPNDLLSRLAAARARVVDVPVRPVYGPNWRSGLRPLRVAPTIAWLLARALWRRMRARWRGSPAAIDETAEVAAPS